MVTPGPIWNTVYCINILAGYVILMFLLYLFNSVHVSTPLFSSMKCTACMHACNAMHLVCVQQVCRGISPLTFSRHRPCGSAPFRPGRSVAATDSLFSFWSGTSSAARHAASTPAGRMTVCRLAQLLVASRRSESPSNVKPRRSTFMRCWHLLAEKKHKLLTACCFRYLEVLAFIALVTVLSCVSPSCYRVSMNFLPFYRITMNFFQCYRVTINVSPCGTVLPRNCPPCHRATMDFSPVLSCFHVFLVLTASF